MRARILRRFLWSAFALLTAALLLLQLFAARFIARSGAAGLERRLAAETAILAARPPALADAQAWARASSARAEARIAILGAGGAAIADSSSPSEDSPGAALARPEVQAARAGRPGLDVRRDASGEEFVYAAAPLPMPEEAGATLRLSAPLAPARKSAAELQRLELSVSLAAIAAAAALAWAFLRSFSRRMVALRAYVEALLDPRLPDGELPASDDELGALARSLRRAAPQIRDLVDRLKLEGARREAILASMVEGVLAVDKDLKVTFCNNSFARDVGVRVPVPPGAPLLDLVRDPELLDIMTTVLSTGERVERRLMLTGVGSRWFEVLAGPLANPAHRGALAILHDITKIEKLERVRKDFVANVSHELRTPLAAIRGYAETLLDGALEDKENNYKFVEIVLAHSIRLNNIASDLLTLSELESSAAAAPQTRVSIRSSLEAALHTVEPGARVRGIALKRGEIADLRVMGQEFRLEQAFVNLLDNAVKFNRPNGEVCIETRAGGGQASISVSDTGIGIPSEHVSRIFERFYRVDTARSRAVGGTGLGLSIVRHIIEQMGGTIAVESDLGKGSRFTVTLPCCE